MNDLDGLTVDFNNKTIVSKLKMMINKIFNEAMLQLKSIENEKNDTIINLEKLIETLKPENMEQTRRNICKYLYMYDGITSVNEPPREILDDVKMNDSDKEKYNNFSSFVKKRLDIQKDKIKVIRNFQKTLNTIQNETTTDNSKLNDFIKYAIKEERECVDNHSNILFKDIFLDTYFFFNILVDFKYLDQSDVRVHTAAGIFFKGKVMQNFFKDFKEWLEKYIKNNNYI